MDLNKHKPLVLEALIEALVAVSKTDKHNAIALKLSFHEHHPHKQKREFPGYQQNVVFSRNQ